MNATQTQALQSGLVELRRLNEGSKTLWQSGQLGACWPLVKEQLSVVDGLEATMGESPEALAALRGLGADLKDLKNQVFGEEGAARSIRTDHAALLSAFELLEKWSNALEVAVFPKPRWRRLSKPVVVCVGIGALLLGWRLQPTVRASASHSPVYEPSLAADDIESTEWLLPDAKLGWVEVRFARPRDVEVVELMNSMNRPYRDRASKDVRVELLNERERLASRVAVFPPHRENGSVGEWLNVPARAKGVTRVRVHIDSYYGIGGGLAEVAVH